MASPQNQITYGSFSFPFANLTSNSSSVYAEDGMTRVGRRYNFVITGWIGGVSQGDLQTKIAAMQQTLGTPRLNFRVHWTGDGSTDLFFYVPATTGTPSSSGAEINWGPKPGELNLTKFAGGRVAMYQWTLELTSMDASVKSDVLAATWQFAHVVDASGYTTRTVRGKILVDSGIVATGQGADYFRNVVAQALPVLRYFKRENQEYTQSEDGRILSFSVTDTETYYSLPKPVTSGHASWMVRLHGIGEEAALTVDYILSGWFESSAAHGKQELIAAVFNLAQAKFGTAASTGPALIFTERVFREDVYGRNRVDFSMTAIQPGGGSLDGNININVGVQTFGIQPPNSDGNYLIPNPYGETDNLTSGAYAPAPLQYDADPPTGVNQSGGYNFNNAGDPGLIFPINSSAGSSPAGDQALQTLVQQISERHQKFPFVAFHEVITYEYDNHIVVLVPKVSTAQPFAQQTAVPSLTVIQAGYSQQIAKVASDIPLFGNPPAFVSGGDFVVCNAYVSTPVAEPISDGTYNVYKAEWRYVFKKTKQPVSGDFQLLPFDPRRPGNPDAPIEIDSSQLPDIIETPDQ